MKQLLSKVQYKRYEAGEFSDIAIRGLEETVTLIREFPWETQRALASVELTCPSVTIEHSTGGYLKLGPYFAEKYCFYYCSGEGRVWEKPVTGLEEALVLLASFFNDPTPFEPEKMGFQKYTFVFNPVKHFKTNSFEYTVNGNAVLRHLKIPVFICLALLIIGLTRYFSGMPVLLSQPALSVLLLFFLIFVCPVMILYFNHRRHDENLYLQISSGQDQFSFGMKERKKIFSKEDIIGINVIKTRASRSPWRENLYYKIQFANQELISFTSLLISESEFLRKFPDHQPKEIYRFLPMIGAQP